MLNGSVVYKKRLEYFFRKDDKYKFFLDFRICNL